MIRQAFKRLWHDKRGNALLIAGAAMPLVIGSAGLASDTIQWALWKRQIQRAADSAALAGVYHRIQNDGSTSAVATAVDYDLTRHNFAKPSLLAPATITYPTQTNWGFPVRVALSIQQRLNFSSFFMSTPPVITATGTAATIPTGVYCVVSLVDTSTTGIKSTGNGNLNLGCGMITNSTSLTAAIATGSSSVNATPVAAVGDIQESTNWGGAELLPFTVKQADPYEDVTVPAFAACQGGGTAIRINPNAGDTTTYVNDTGTRCISDFDVNGELKLGSATYIIDGGSFNARASAKISCTGCTIILTNSDSGTNPTIGTVDIAGGAQINMTAPNDPTNPFDGILFYQDRRATESDTITNKINGNSLSTFEGAFYFPKQQLQINGDAGLNMTCGQFVSYVVEFAGNGSINNTCTAGYGDNEIMGEHVRLVA